MIVIKLETPQLSLQVNNVPKENLIKKFAPYASDQPLHEGMRNWRVGNRFEFIYLKNTKIRQPSVVSEQRIIIRGQVFLYRTQFSWTRN